MTHQEIKNLRGRYLDAEIAMRVFSRKVEWVPIIDNYGASRYIVCPYCNHPKKPMECPDKNPPKKGHRLGPCYPSGAENDPWYIPIEDFSTSMGDCWKVVEKMKLRGYSFGFWDVPGISGTYPGPQAAYVLGGYPLEREKLGEESLASASNWETALTICHAALLALNGS